VAVDQITPGNDHVVSSKEDSAIWPEDLLNHLYEWPGRDDDQNDSDQPSSQPSSPHGFFPNAQMPDVSHGTFNDIGGDQLNYAGQICNQVGDGSNYFRQSVHFTTIDQNGPFTMVSFAQFACLGAMYSRNSLIEARQDKLEQMLALARHHSIATSTLFSFLALIYMYAMKYHMHVAS